MANRCFRFSHLLPLFFAAATLRATVMPPVEARLDVTATHAESFVFTAAASVPDVGIKNEAKLRLTLRPSGIVSLAGKSEWEVTDLTHGRTYQFESTASLSGYGEGSLELDAESFDASGKKLWGRSETLFVLNTPDDQLLGKSSVVELKREKLNRQLGRGELTSKGYQDEMRNLVQGRELGFERKIRVLESGKKKSDALQPTPTAVATTTVSGTIRYTHRIGRSGGNDVFAAAASALPVRQALITFFDKTATALTPLTSTPATVRTDNSGNYSATVPGTRADSTAVDLVVRVSADNPAARTGPSGQRTLIYSKDTAPLTVSSANTTANMTMDSTDLLGLRVFAIQDGMLTAFNFVNSNNTATGVGAAPSQIFVEFPGTNASGSFFSRNTDDHLNIGQGHAFDWDVYMHEYGHYVQKINNTTANPGGCHYINSNMTGFDQSTCGSASRVLTKQQAIQLAWGEGWPTFFGTNLQISSGAGAWGIYGVADTRYTDTANNFSYDLESNSGSFVPPGEDNELSVQRILWDFADAPQDGHDEIVYGTNFMWQQLAGDTAMVTLDAMRGKFTSLYPPAAAGYSVGGLNLVQNRQGKVYFDMNVGPEPVAPADNIDASGPPPTFTWKTKGAGDAPSYHFNKFNVLFFTEDYSRLIFTSPEIATAAGATTGSWTPIAGDWSTITAADPVTKSSVVKWYVQGTNDTLAPATGPYPGLDRTLNVVDVAFVIDDTGSMTEEIAGVRAGLTAYITAVKALALPKNPLVEVVTFKDDVTHRITTRDLNAVQTVVDGLFAAGGDDCPEASGEALLETAKNLGSGRSIIFATDASSHAGFDLTGVKQEIRSRGITLTEIVSGDCNSAGGASIVARSMTVATGSNPNHDSSYTQPPRLPSMPDIYFDVTCPACPPDSSVGPSLSENAFKTIGDYSLTTPSAVAGFQSIAAASPGGKFLYYPGVNSGDSTPYQNAVTNTALSATVPTVVATAPVDLVQGATMDVVVLGGATNFQRSSVATISGTGVTINSSSTLSPTTIRLNVTVGGTAAVGFRDVSVATSLGGGATETAGGTGQTRVIANSSLPLITSIFPSSMVRGTTADVIISTLNVDLGSTPSLYIGGATVNSVTPLSATSLRANLTVPANATLGLQYLSVTGTASTAYSYDGFSITDAALGPSLRTISVIPTAIGRGKTVTLDVTGSNTNFQNGVTTASISGTGVTVVSMTVTSPTQATIQVSVAIDAALGFRDISVTTGGEVATLTAGLLISGSAPGDANGDGAITVSDVFYLINNLFAGGPAPIGSGDANGDGSATVSDVFYLINYLFAGGPAPH